MNEFSTLNLRKLIPMCYLELKNAFQVQNGHIFLDFFIWIFLIISSFLDLSAVFFSKTSSYDNIPLINRILNASSYLE